MAYLKNQLGINAVAVRQGDINLESKFILDKFLLDIPRLKTSFANEDIFLVDFNNYTEAPDDIKDANIVGIVDHHKLGGLSTVSPIECQIKAVGCTNTIIKEMFDYHSIEIPQNIAGAMMCAILSDTVIFKSPTCTKVDTKIVKQLAKIAKIDDFKALGLEMFKVKSDVLGVPMENLIKRDYKPFDMYGQKVGIGQLEVVDLSIFDEIKDDLKIKLKEFKEQNNLHTIVTFNRYYKSR
jgi:manganese-dependent inorganic pyrophosphatase